MAPDVRDLRTYGKERGTSQWGPFFNAFLKMLYKLWRLFSKRFRKRFTNRSGEELRRFSANPSITYFPTRFCSSLGLPLRFSHAQQDCVACHCEIRSLEEDRILRSLLRAILLLTSTTICRAAQHVGRKRFHHLLKSTEEFVGCAIVKSDHWKSLEYCLP
jgi:hypothetical protein